MVLKEKDLDKIEELNKDIISREDFMAKKFRQICELKRDRIKLGIEIGVAKNEIRKLLGYNKLETDELISKVVNGRT